LNEAPVRRGLFYWCFRFPALSNFVYRIHSDGSGLRKALEQPIPLLFSASRDGRWVVGWSLFPDHEGMGVQAFPLEGGAPVTIGAHAALDWSSGGNSVAVAGGPIADNQSYIVPLPPGEALPQLPADGLRSEQDVAKLPGARRVDAVAVPGPSPDVYAFYRGSTQRNLYRIPLQ